MCCPPPLITSNRWFGGGIERRRPSQSLVSRPTGVGVGTPASSGQGAAVDGHEQVANGADERYGLPLAVVAPAEKRTVGTQPARMEAAGADGREEELFRWERFVFLVPELLRR